MDDGQAYATRIKNDMVSWWVIMKIENSNKPQRTACNIIKNIPLYIPPIQKWYKITPYQCFSFSSVHGSVFCYDRCLFWANLFLFLKGHKCATSGTFWPKNGVNSLCICLFLCRTDSCRRSWVLTLEGKWGKKKGEMEMKMEKWLISPVYPGFDRSIGACMWPVVKLVLITDEENAFLEAEQGLHVGSLCDLQPGGKTRNCPGEMNRKS